MLRETAESGDYFRLVRYFSPQKNLTYCGVASSVMVLNALPVPKPEGRPYGTFPFFTQENFFSAEATAIKPPVKVAASGLTLSELEGMLNAHPGVEARKTYASRTTLEEFRKLARAQMGSPDQYILVNYLRKAVGQNTGGHISPLAAYHERTDSFLILDVAQYKYPPVWVPAPMLWDAMSPREPDGTVSRGFVVVGVKPPESPVSPF